jgi:hypothetical protein
MRKPRKRRRIERQKMEQIAQAVKAGEPLEPALAKEGISQANYEAWFRANEEYLFPDVGAARPFVFWVIIAGGLLMPLGGCLGTEVLIGLGWSMIAAMIAFMAVDSLQRGVWRNWNAPKQILRFDDSPFGFMASVTIQFVMGLFFLSWGLVAMARGLGLTGLAE